MNHKPLIIAHRGNSALAPENTLEAFRQALALDIDGIELDVHLSSDNVPVVIHDVLLQRTTNAPSGTAVSHFSAEKLARLDAGSWFDKKYANEPIPTLKQVLQLEFKKRKLFIELKQEAGTDCRQLVTSVLDVVGEVNPRYPIIMGSFSQEVIDQVQAQAPNQPTCGIAEEVSAIESMAANGYSHLSIWDRLATPERVAQLRSKGIEVWVFTVNDPERAKHLASIGIGGIITDHPSILIARD